MIYDLIIIGGGPAGATAAIYCARDDKEVAVIEKEVIGGRITESPKVDNIPGFNNISGADFGNKLDVQLEENGIEVFYDNVIRIDKQEDLFIVYTDEDSYESKSIIIATGTKNRLLGLPEEEKLIGKFISFCVACDGIFYKGKNVIVVGGGNSAITEAIELANYCKKVTIVQNLDHLTATKSLLTELENCLNVEILLGEELDKYLINSEGKCEGISLKSGKNIFADGLFMAIGQIPQNELFKDYVELDKNGYIIATNGCTKTSGIFACGDCVSGSVQQVVTACGSGAIAALGILNYLRG